MPLLFGTADLAGTVIYLDALIEHSSETGGKGGPEQKVFNYTQTIAIGLAERVDDFADPGIGAIGGITRAWENGQLVYDIRPQQQANTALGLLAETDEEYAQRLTISADYAETFTLYLGTETQDPDPTIEAAEGMGNVPGFRGLAYIVYPNRNLQEGQGLRHPNFTFECYQDGTGTCFDSNENSNEVLYPWTDSRNTYQVQVIGLPITGLPSPPTSINFASIDDAVAAAFTYCGILQNVSIGYEILQSTADGVGTVGVVPCAGAVGFDTVPDPSGIIVVYNYKFPLNGIQDLSSYDPFFYEVPGREWYSYGNRSGGNHCITFTTDTPDSDNTPPALVSPNQQQSRVFGWWFQSINGLVMEQRRFPGAPTDPCVGLPPSVTHPGFADQPDGTIVECNSWVKDTTTGCLVLQAFAASTGVSPNFNHATQHPLNPCLPTGSPGNTSAFWEAAYAQAVSDGTMAAGLIYGIDYPKPQSFFYSLDKVVCEGSGAPANVADVISAICKRAGLTADQIDVSDLEEITVAGYSISGICDAADIISPLRSLAFFDCVESGNQLRFPTRGKEIVATLTEDQFGCFDGDPFGESSSIPPKVTVTRADETTLPRSIRLHYKAVSRDYQDGEQDSPMRLTTKAVDDQDISIPLCIGDNQAVQAAEINWADAWAAQNSYTISIDQSLLELEGADCIGVPVDGFITRMRIVGDSNASAVLRKLTLVGDDGGSYISFAESQPPQRAPQQLQQLSPSLAAFLNIPALSDADNNAGFYVVAWPDPTIGNTWRGAQLFISVDGVVYTPSVLVPTAATVGTINTAVPRSESFTFDEYTVITIDCDKSQSFTSRTDDAVLSGANAAVMGADGRWEVVQFCNAEQITPTQWQLSRLLRGRRGTEYVMGTSIAGDQFIMVSTGDIVRVPLSVSQIGAQYVYKMVTSGASLAATPEVDFVSRGQALVCFAPVDAEAHFNSSGDIEISWTRRDRLGETLMSGMDIPLSDYPLTFSIDIVQGQSPDSPAVIFRTLSTGTTSVVYSQADFLIDYAGESPSSPETIHVRIYQVSLTTGRGIPLIASLPVT